MAFSNLEILARTIQCEAGGEGEIGMKAVACVIMNRVQVTYGEYGRLENTIRAVVYQERQFTCVMESINGVYNMQNIYNMRPTQLHYDIANWAIAGNRLTNLGFALWYFNPFSPECPEFFPSNVGHFVIRIGDHCFYNPTAAYANT
ncbi:MAG: cell wall hydrolase [Clostridiales bacterium]|nr:cell wall hydrolase [Clostridiales bacterium]